MSRKTPTESVSNILFPLLVIISMLSYRFIDLTGISLHSVMFFIIAIALLIPYTFSKQQKKTIYIRETYRSTDLVALLLVGFELLHIITSFFDTESKGAFDLNSNVVILASVFIYYVISEGLKWKEQYFDILIYLGLATIGVYLFGYFCYPSLLEAITNIYGTKAITTSYFLPIIIISICRYCLCQDKMQSAFLLMTSCAGFFVLLINHCIISFWLLIIVFLLIPILFCPTAELIKRDMQMLFTFVFMLSNMSLFTNYILKLQIEGEYLLSKSVYIDLLLAVGGVIFFHFWDEIPENTNLHKLLLDKMPRRFGILLTAISMLFTGIIVGGDSWNSLSEGLVNDAFKSFALPLIEETKQETNMLFYLLEKQGVIGTMLLLIMGVMVLLLILKNYHVDKPITSIMFLITILFFLQSFFWMPSESMLPIYIIAMLFAVFQRESKKDWKPN